MKKFLISTLLLASVSLPNEASGGSAWALEECRPGIQCRYLRIGYSGQSACEVDLHSQAWGSPKGTRLRCVPVQPAQRPFLPPITCEQWGVDFCRVP